MLGGIIAALVALVSNGWVNALLVVGVVVLVNQLEGNFLQPVLMGRSMRLHSFAILIVLAGRRRDRRHPRRRAGGSDGGRRVGRDPGVGWARHPRALGASEPSDRLLSAGDGFRAARAVPAQQASAAARGGCATGIRQSTTMTCASRIFTTIAAGYTRL